MPKIIMVASTDEEQECEECGGFGQVEIASTTSPEDNEWVECQPCEGTGVIYQEEVIPF